MFIRLAYILPLLAVLAAGPAIADPVSDRASFTVERHFTTNAFDETVAVSDWYTLLRGSVGHELSHDLGHTRIGAEGELRRYDEYAIENDGRVALHAETRIQPGEDLEIRAGLSFIALDEGDALVFDDLAIGTRTRKTIAGARLETGLRLAPDLVWSGNVVVEAERSGKTRFQDGLADPVRLEPHRDRLEMTTAVTRSQGLSSYGLRLSSALIGIDHPGLLRQVGLRLHGLRGEYSTTIPGGAVLALSAGAQWLHDDLGLANDIRPALDAVLAYPVASMLQLRGAVSVAFDTRSADDLLAAWVRKASLGMEIPLAPALRMGTGAFVERHAYLVAGYSETVRGTFAELGWEARPGVTLLMRLDYRSSKAPSIAVEKQTLDAFVGISTRI